jgi:hypothetical protein
VVCKDCFFFSRRGGTGRWISATRNRWRALSSWASFGDGLTVEEKARRERRIFYEAEQGRNLDDGVGSISFFRVGGAMAGTSASEVA